MSELKWKEIALPSESITISRPTWPLKIEFDCIGTLDPKDDMTPKEAVQLSMMLACGVSGNAFVDYASFVKENGLSRHFKGR